jgi:hypothetical protein
MLERLCGTGSGFDIAVHSAAFEVAVEIGFIDEDFPADTVMRQMPLADELVHLARRDAGPHCGLFDAEHYDDGRGEAECALS